MGGDDVIHADRHKIVELNGHEYNTAKNYNPNGFLVPYGGKFLVDAPDVILAIHLTQEEVKKLSEIKASFSLKK